MFYIFIRSIAKLFIRIKFRMEIIGMEHIPENGPVIVAANHTSNYDPIILFSAFQRKIHFLAKHELFRSRLSNWFFNKLHAIPVDRGGVVIRPVRHSLKVINEGEVLGIFPEGSRCKNGEMVKPKKGVVFLGLKTRAPILPIVLVGVKKGLRQPVKVIIGPLIHVTDLGIVEYSALSQAIMDRIRELGKIH